VVVLVGGGGGGPCEADANSLALDVWDATLCKGFFFSTLLLLKRDLNPYTTQNEHSQGLCEWGAGIRHSRLPN